AHSTSPHSRAGSSPRDAQGTPTQSAAQDSSLQCTAEIQGTADLQGTTDFQGTAETQGITDIPKSPNDYTPTNASQTSGGDEGLLDLYALNREVRRLKKQNISQAKQIRKLKAKLKKLSKVVGGKAIGQKHHIHWVKSQKLHKKRKVDETEERNSDETEEVIIEEEKDTFDVKSRDTEELDFERIQSTARQSAVTPRTLNFDDEAGPSSPILPTQEEEPEERFKDAEFLADIPLNINRPIGLSIPGPMQSQPQQLTQTTDPKEKGKGILIEEPKKKKLTLQQIRALETAHDEEVARKGQGYKNLQKLRYPQMKELYDKVQESIKDSFKDFIPMGLEKEKQMLQERDAKRLLRKRKATVTEEQPSKKLKLRT
ncbi:hypothetical protein Tco_0716939, partial [Tanacetum coccineum]